MQVLVFISTPGKFIFSFFSELNSTLIGLLFTSAESQHFSPNSLYCVPNKLIERFFPCVMSDNSFRTLSDRSLSSKLLTMTDVNFQAKFRWRKAVWTQAKSRIHHNLPQLNPSPLMCPLHQPTARLYMLTLWRAHSKQPLDTLAWCVFCLRVTERPAAAGLTQLDTAGLSTSFTTSLSIIRQLLRQGLLALSWYQEDSWGN